jgi:hypothetical protein
MLICVSQILADFSHFKRILIFCKLRWAIKQFKSHHTFLTEAAVLGIGFTRPTPTLCKWMKKVVKNPYKVLLNVNSQHLDKLHSAHVVHTKHARRVTKSQIQFDWTCSSTFGWIALELLVRAPNIDCLWAVLGSLGALGKAKIWGSYKWIYFGHSLKLFSIYIVFPWELNVFLTKTFHSVCPLSNLKCTFRYIIEFGGP